MSIEHIRLSARARDQLITLKRRTGIENWNILCRWALCVSLSTGIGKPVPDAKIPADSNIEMNWKTFAGQHDELYWALVKERCRTDELDPADAEVVAHQFRLHLHRGIQYLAANRNMQSIGDLIGRAVA